MEAVELRGREGPCRKHLSETSHQLSSSPQLPPHFQAMLGTGCGGPGARPWPEKQRSLITPIPMLSTTGGPTQRWLGVAVRYKFLLYLTPERNPKSLVGDNESIFRKKSEQDIFYSPLRTEQ